MSHPTGASEVRVAGSVIAGDNPAYLVWAEVDANGRPIVSNTESVDGRPIVSEAESPRDRRLIVSRAPTRGEWWRLRNYVHARATVRGVTSAGKAIFGVAVWVSQSPRDMSPGRGGVRVHVPAGGGQVRTHRLLWASVEEVDVAEESWV